MDDISRLFDDVTPEDFFGSSAYRIRFLQPEHQIDATLENFYGFISEMVEMTRIAVDHANEFQIISIGMLHRRDEERIFRPDVLETHEIFIERVKREMLEFDSQWLYVAIPSRALLGETVSHQEIKKREKDLVPTINWYARDRVNDMTLYGIITLSDIGTIKVSLGIDMQGMSPLFADLQ